MVSVEVIHIFIKIIKDIKHTHKKENVTDMQIDY